MAMQEKTPSALHIFFMLFLVYITWGSTFIGYKLTLEVVGPFFAAGGRSLGGGVLLMALLMLLGHWTRPTRRALNILIFQGLPMVAVASGFVGLGQTQIPSSVAAVLSSATPILMIAAGYFFAGEPRPAGLQIFGLFTGTCGIIALGWLQRGGDTGEYPLLGCLALILADIGWVAGSLLKKKHSLTREMHPLEQTSLLLVFGGIECFLIGFILGEQGRMHWENLRPAVIIAFSWLTIGSSLIAYSAYMWLLMNAPLSVAVSYEYVNPVIGIVLGWLIGGEMISPGIIVSCAVIISSVFFVLMPKTARTQPLGHHGVFARWRLERAISRSMHQQKTSGASLRK